MLQRVHILRVNSVRRQGCGLGLSMAHQSFSEQRGRGAVKQEANNRMTGVETSHGNRSEWFLCSICLQRIAHIYSRHINHFYIKKFSAKKHHTLFPPFTVPIWGPFWEVSKFVRAVTFQNIKTLQVRTFFKQNKTIKYSFQR